MEGVPPTPRRPRTSGGHRQRKNKHDKTAEVEKKPKGENEQYIKSDPGQLVNTGESPFDNHDPFVKAERLENDDVARLSLDSYGIPADPSNMEIGEQMSMDGSSSTFGGDFGPMEGNWSMYPTVKTESNIKMEPEWGH